MTGYWLGILVGLGLGFYIGIFLMIVLRLAKKRDQRPKYTKYAKYR